MICPFPGLSGYIRIRDIYQSVDLTKPKVDLFSKENINIHNLIENRLFCKLLWTKRKKCLRYWKENSMYLFLHSSFSLFKENSDLHSPTITVSPQKMKNSCLENTVMISTEPFFIMGRISLPKYFNLPLQLCHFALNANDLACLSSAPNVLLLFSMRDRGGKYNLNLWLKTCFLIYLLLESLNLRVLDCL